MNRKTNYRPLVMMIVLPLLLIGLTSCSQKQVATETPVQTMPEYAPAPVYQQAVPPQNLMEDQLRWENEARNAFLNNRIYFDYNKYDIRPDSVQILRQKADYMNRNPGMNVEIQGHCDERGTEAYNLALGDRRSHATKKYLTDLGVDRDRMFTVSYGEEYPLVPGHNEQAWSQNRRVEFVITQ